VEVDPVDLKRTRLLQRVPWEHHHTRAQPEHRFVNLGQDSTLNDGENQRSSKNDKDRRPNE
jgi:hypothetical protein